MAAEPHERVGRVEKKKYKKGRVQQKKKKSKRKKDSEKLPPTCPQVRGKPKRVTKQKKLFKKPRSKNEGGI